MPASLRLTLRTLLSYLDDTLDPAQAKLIGQKVAESEQARELMERIKQVTRKRRLTTPPPAGPGGIDANTIAEYLDNEVTPEQAEEVERICLASDVHLAEVAACHQILTLVLGEPALVPPSARQRMYGLVKGPEAIPFRKPPRKKGNADLDLSTSDAGLEGDESMRAPSFMRHASVRNTVLLVGGTVAAVCLLIVALWWGLNQGRTGEGEQHPKGPAVAQVDANAKDKDQDKKTPDENRTEPTPPPKSKDDGPKPQPKTIPEEPTPKVDDKKAVSEIPPGQEEIPFEPPDVQPVVLGTYQVNAKSPGVTLQREGSDNGNWTRLWTKDPSVQSVRPIMSLPVSRGQIQLKKGLLLTLWGSSPEVWPLPFLYESRARLYNHPTLDLDMTLERGRVVIKNLRTDGKPAMLRIRYENFQQKKQEAFTIALLEKDSEVFVEHWAYFDRDEPFYEDKNNKMRLGPTVRIHCFLLSGTAYFRWGGNLDTLDTENNRYLTWDTAHGGPGAPQKASTPAWALPNPKAGRKEDEKIRQEAFAASKRLAMNLHGKELDVVLQEALASDNSATQRLALTCFTALDDYTKPVEYLDKDAVKQSELRMVSLYALKYWMAQGSDNEYKVYDAFVTSYRPIVAKKLMALLHGLTPREEADPATWQRLIDGLNNDVLPMRELCMATLTLALRDVPAVTKALSRYAPIAPPEVRAAVQRDLRMVIPPGQLPPQPGAPPPSGAPKKKQ